MTPSDLRSIRREAGLSMNGLARLLGVLKGERRWQT